MPPRRWILVALLSALLSGPGPLLGQLIRPIYVYKNLIGSIHDYFNNTCIILLHATVDSVETQGLEQGDGLLALQMYLSAHLHIRTSIMDFQMFMNRVGFSYHHIKRPLFVLLNDQQDVKEQFTHVSTWIAMSYPTWLVFLGNETAVTEFFADIYVPFDCTMLAAKPSPDGGEDITEVYRIHREDPVRMPNFGSWDPGSGLTGPKLGMYQRRNDLHGHSIRVASVNDPPVSWMVRNEENEVTGLRGFFGNVIELLREGMNCTFSYREATASGNRLPNGSWTGMIDMLLKDEIDLAATGMLMTADRMDAVEFTTPIYSTKCRTFIKRPPSTAVNWNAYLAPFARQIWFSLAVLIIVATGTITIINAAVGNLGSPMKDYENAPSRFSEIVFQIFGAFCSQGMQTSLLDPVRLVQLVIHLTAVVIVAAYSAALISFLAVKTFVMPFTTMEGLLEDGTYRFAVLADSADYSFFQNTTDRVLAVMFEELLTRETDLPRNYLDGLRRVCSHEKYAFMTLDHMAAVLRNEVSCILEPLDVMLQATVALAVPNGYPYRGLINSNILLLRDSGLLQRLITPEWSTSRTKQPSTWTSVEMRDIFPLLLFILTFVFLSIFIFFLEHNVHRQVKTGREKR